MTKGQYDSSRWLAQRCIFLRSGGELCDVCRESFGMFWSGRSRKQCEFCGCQIHSRCSSYIELNEGDGRARICQRCYTYKFTYSNVLTQGDEFIAYTGRFPAASYLCLSEESSSLLLTIDPSDVEEKILLSEIVNIQRGFSHAGHMKAASLYDPLRCFSITVNTPQGLKAYDLKTESLVHCERWITLLKSALEVYHRLSDQEQAVIDYTELGHTLPQTGHLYFPDKKTTRSHSGSSNKRQKTTDASQYLIPQIEILEKDDMVVVETISERASTSRETTPTSDPSASGSDDNSHSPIVRKAHYKIRTLHTPHLTPSSSSTGKHRHERLTATLTSRKSLTDWRLDSTTSRGLPYKGKRNPLASNCSCHAYAIESSRTFLFPLSANTQNDPFKSCCELCRGKCRVAHDLSTF